MPGNRAASEAARARVMPTDSRSLRRLVRLGTNSCPDVPDIGPVEIVGKPHALDFDEREPCRSYRRRRRLRRRAENLLGRRRATPAGGQYQVQARRTRRRAPDDPVPIEARGQPVSSARSAHEEGVRSVRWFLRSCAGSLRWSKVAHGRFESVAELRARLCHAIQRIQERLGPVQGAIG